MIENAQIESTRLSMADHGVLTYYIDLKMGMGGHCSYGGYVLGHGYLGSKHFDGSDKSIVALMRIMDVVGVEKWEDLKGKYVRVESNGLGTPIEKIGNVMEDKWFNQKEFFESQKD